MSKKEVGIIFFVKQPDRVVFDIWKTLKIFISLTEFAVKKLSLVLALLSLALPGIAQADNPIEQCYKTATTQEAIRECNKQELKIVRKEYRELVDKLIKEANELDRVIGRNEATPALERANMAFDRYVAEQCKFEQKALGGGRGATSANLTCQINWLQWRMGSIENFFAK